MVPIAQATDFGGSIRVPAAFCGIVGIRPTPGLVPSYPMPLAWDPGQVNGPLARDAEDAALMLDAIVGFSRLSPISVAPPWRSALLEVERRRDAKGLRVAYVSDIAGIGVDAEIDEICRKRALRLAAAGAQVEEIEFDALATAARPIRPGAASGWSASNISVSARSTSSGQSEGQRRGRPEIDALDLAAAEQKRQEVFHRFRAVRALRRPADAGRAGETVPDREEFSRPDQRQETSKTISTGSRRLFSSRWSVCPPRARRRA
jgi:amidase